jgi:hypothetical protein
MPRKLLYIIIPVLLPLLLASCGKKPSGKISFKIDGRYYEFEKVELRVRVDPQKNEGEKLKWAKMHEVDRYEYMLGTNVREFMKQQKKPVLKRRVFLGLWYCMTDNPGDLSGEVSWANRTKQMEDFDIAVYVPGMIFRTPESKDHDFWIRFTKFASKTAAGQFGGHLRAVTGGGGEYSEREFFVTEGSFEVPVRVRFMLTDKPVKQ